MFSNRLKLFFGILFWLLFSIPASACSWSLPEGTTSEWVEDKVVFWGRAIETKWNKNNESDWHEFENYTNIEVLEQVKGELPKKIRVYHSMRPAGCGIYYQLGDIRLFVIPREKSGRKFRSSAPNEEAVSQLILTAYFVDGIDLPLNEARLVERWSMDNPCRTPSLNNASKPDYCKWEEAFNQAKRSYTDKTSLLLKSENKKWWQK